MDSNTIIISMTTWPPRYTTVVQAMSAIVKQRDAEGLDVHCVLVLSSEEVTSRIDLATHVIRGMEELGVEVIIDRGNIRSHKKLIPTLERYPDNPILVVDDDNIQLDGWLRTFVADHAAHPHDIIYGQGNSRVFWDGSRIVEDRSILLAGMVTPGEVTTNVKPANGAAGTLYPPHTFTAPRFFDRKLFMRLSPTSDETWQWAFAKIAGRTFRNLSAFNMPLMLGADQMHSLYQLNRDRYTDIHNAIAAEIPEYGEVIRRETSQSPQ